ncbi:MAG: YlbL family protein [Aeromicrobium sp.]
MSDPALRPSRRYLTMVVASLSLIVLSCVAFLVPVPYVTMRPGPAFDTFGKINDKPMISFGEGVKTYPTTGSLDFTTVSVTRAETNVSLAQAVEAYFADDTAVVPRSFIYRQGVSAKDAKAEGQAQLASSKDSSRVAALRAAGYTVPEMPTIDSVGADGSAKGKLQVGDEISSVDGRSTTTARDVVEAVGRIEPGDTVTISFIRDGEKQSVDIITRPDAINKELPRIGVMLRSTFDFPITITNNVGEQVGGPSAGAMFALAIYDRLTPGSLTGGREVAGTGEITPDGTIGPIGGIRQKIAGAADDGAKVFLVPAANCAEASGGDDHGMRLVKVSKLDDAIDSLEELADDSKATVPRCL